MSFEGHIGSVAKFFTFRPFDKSIGFLMSFLLNAYDMLLTRGFLELCEQMLYCWCQTVGGLRKTSAITKGDQG